MSDYEFRRGSLVLRKTALGRDIEETPDHADPLVNSVNESLTSIFAKKNSDVNVRVTYYESSRRPNLSIVKKSGANIGMQISCDVEHGALLLSSMSAIYAALGQDVKQLEKAVEYAQGKLKEMKQKHADQA